MTTAAGLKSSADRSASIDTLDITVLLGGPGPEREVSLNSGRAVADALTRLGHRVTCSDIDSHRLDALDIPADLIFIALHGTFGEDGALQELLEQRGLCYAGSDAASSRLAMDKVRAKQALIAASLPTPAFDVADVRDDARTLADRRLPAVVKPVDQGSSVDTFMVHTPAELSRTVEQVLQRHRRCLIEDRIIGPELTVGIVGTEALPVCEIRTSREFYDYHAKYLDDATEYLFDLDLPAELLEHIQALSLLAHRALGCRHFSRVDWMVQQDTGQPYILEINTIPGFTDHSLLPKAAARANMTFDALCRRIVDLAVGRQPR